MNEVINNIMTRRSCKKFRSDPVPAELIGQIAEAGLFAASGGGRQAPLILAVSDKATRDQLSRLNARYDALGRKDPFYNAPVVLAVVVERSDPTAVYDGSLVLGNMMLAAHSLGVGSCWIHRAKEVFEDEEAKDLLRAQGLEGDYIGIGHLALGYPEVENTAVIPRKENRIYRID